MEKSSHPWKLENGSKNKSDALERGPCIFSLHFKGGVTLTKVMFCVSCLATV